LSRRARRALLSGIAVLAALAAGCGKKGPPLPPLGHRPEPPAAVEARQVGAELVFAFVLPVRYTDGDPLAGPPTVRVLRETLGSAPVVVQSFDPEVVRAAPGTRVSLAIPVAAAFEGVTAGTATFRVETQGPKGKASAWSAPLAVTRADPLPAPTGLGLRQSSEGIALEWTAAADAPKGLGYNVYRRAASDAEWGTPLNATPLESALFMDRDAAVGLLYEYRVEAVIGDSKPPRASAPSDAVRIQRRDETAPDPPTEVRAVAGADGVRVFWFPPHAADLAGFRVYRAANDVPFEAIAELPRDATYHLDASVTAGVTYFYRVTAFDGASPTNESEPSEAVSETVPTPPTEPMPAVPPGT
jgi:predicted small lipoprotein YifL